MVGSAGLTWMTPWFLPAALMVASAMALSQRALFAALAIGAGSFVVEHWVVNSPVSSFAAGLGPAPALAFCASLVALTVLSGPAATSSTWRAPLDVPATRCDCAPTNADAPCPCALVRHGVTHDGDHDGSRVCQRW